LIFLEDMQNIENLNSYLKLVLASLCGGGWVEEIDCENLGSTSLASIFIIY